MGPLLKANLIIAGICMPLAFLHLAIYIRRPELKAHFFSPLCHSAWPEVHISKPGCIAQFLPTRFCPLSKCRSPSRAFYG